MQAERVRVFKKLSTPGSNFVHSKICYNSRHFISTNRYEVRILNGLYSVRPHNSFYLNTRRFSAMRISPVQYITVLYQGV